MKYDRKLFKRICTLISAVALPAFILRLVTYWSELEIHTGFFKKAPTACLIYNGIGFTVFFLCLFFAVQKLFHTKEKKRPAPDHTSVASGIGANTLLMQNQEFFEVEMDMPELFLQGFARKSAIWEGTLSAFSTFLPGFGFIAYALSFVINPNIEFNAYYLAFALLSALSGAYFIFSGISNSSHKSATRPYFALIPAFWCTVRMVVEYRDLARFVNKTLYIGQFLFIISALLFFLYQAQLLLGEKAMDSPNAYSFSALATAFFGITCRLPQLFAVMGDRISLDLVDASTLIIDLSITLFVFIKIWSLSLKFRG